MVHAQTKALTNGQTQDKARTTRSDDSFGERGVADVGGGRAFVWGKGAVELWR